MPIEKANSDDHEILTEITKRSKSHLGYSKQQLLIWSDALTITTNYLKENQVFKLKNNHKTIGYYSFFYESVKTIKLDNLFILPEYIGNGFGKRLMVDFLKRIENSGAERILLESDPNAEKFYAKFGFVKIGTLETSIKNRLLPVMELNILPDCN